MFIGKLENRATEALDGKEDGRVRAAVTLTDYEGSLLALVLRCQPVTAYQLLKIYAQAPISRCNESKGSLYPLVRRLTARGLLASRRVAGDGRKARLLTCSEAGRAAIRSWATRIEPSHALADDPLLARLDALELLSAGERRKWVAAARQMMVRKMAELEAYRSGTAAPFSELVQAGAMFGLLGRLEWLDLLSRRLDPSVSTGALPLAGIEECGACRNMSGMHLPAKAARSTAFEWEFEAAAVE